MEKKRKTYSVQSSKANCGHLHKTEAEAAECLRILTRYYCNHFCIAGRACPHCPIGIAEEQITSANFWGARVVTNK